MATALAGARRAASVTTPIAVVTAIFAAAGIAVGMIFDWLELTALGFGALVLLIGCSLFLLGRQSIEAQIDMRRNRLQVGDTATATLRARPLGTRASLGARVLVPIGDTPHPFRVPPMRAGSVHEESFLMPTNRRGLFTVGPAQSIVGDPVGLFAQVKNWGQPQTLFVHPRTIPLTRMTAGLLRDLDGQPVPQLSNSDVAFHALRDYIPGDDRRTVHWRSTARTGRLMVRQHEETRRWHLAVALSTERTEYATDDEFEVGVSVAGSLGLHALNHGRDLTLRTHDHTVGAQARNRVLDHLAGVELSEHRLSLDALARDLAVAAPAATIIALVCGSTVTTATLAAARSRLSSSALVFAVRVIPGAKPDNRRMADLAVLTIGALGELPQVMRRLQIVGAGR